MVVLSEMKFSRMIVTKRYVNDVKKNRRNYEDFTDGKIWLAMVLACVSLRRRMFFSD